MNLFSDRKIIYLRKSVFNKEDNADTKANFAFWN